MTKKSENKSMPIMPSQMILPTVDMEYLFRFEGTLAGLEKGLHNDDDPEEIAMQTIEVARDFYDADWCGLISGDLDAGIFYPYWWVNRAEGRMAQTKFDEFEFLQDYDTWTHALLHGENVVLNGLEQRKAGVTASEFRHYQNVVPQNKVPVSCTKTANYNSSLINISFTVCQKKRRAFFLCVSGYFVIVVLTTIKKEKERILPQHVLSLTRECRKQCHCRIYVLIKIGFSADSGHINTIMIRKNALFCKLIRIKKSSKVLFESYMASFCPEREACPICGSSGNCHVHAYYGRRIIDFIHGKPVTQEITVLRLVCVSCGHTHAVLPDMIIPYSGYGLFFILRVLAGAFLDRSSVEALCERFRITRNQFYKWKQIFSQHKQEWLGMLEHSETSGLDFLLGIARLPEYSLFSGGFADKTAYSFLQSHRNPPAMA